MRISDFKNEDAIELLADLIEPIGDLISHKEVKEAIQSKQSKLAIAKVMLSSGKNEVLQILAALNGVPISEFTCNPITIFKDLLTLLNDPELSEVTDFFTSAQTPTIKDASGFVAENTEGVEP